MMKTRGMLFADNDSSSVLAQFRYHKTCFSATGRVVERRAQVKLSASWAAFVPLRPCNS
jgi:hypothetical protein